MPTILNSLADRKVSEVIVCVDAQVVLSWIRTKNVKNKNIFARNRVAEISKYRAEIHEQYGLECNFKYVPTEQNPADLITRGLSISEFERQLDFWSHGPGFISDNQVMWPSSNLGCLSDENKLLACATLEETQQKPIFNVDKFLTQISCFLLLV